jgi:hypothetical protein
MLDSTNSHKYNVLVAVFWILIAAIVAGFILGGGYLIGHSVHDGDALHQQQQIDCIKAGGAPVDGKNGLVCVKS